MMPNIVRGDDMTGLLQYLAGPGRSNEHESPHIVAGDAWLVAAYGGRELDPAAAFEVARDLDQPRVRFGVDVTRMVRSADPETGVVSSKRVGANVWHSSLSLRAEEGQLSDEIWGQIAQDFVDEMGFSGAGGKAQCRWVAVRHGLSKTGNDHIHIAVSMVREDGTKAAVHNDFARAQKVSRELERKYGLELLESDTLDAGSRGVKPAELARAQEQGLQETDRERLERIVRASAAASRNDLEFVDQVRGAGVLVRPRFATGSTTQVVGFSVAARPPAGDSPVWYGGGSLARDLTLPRLRSGWGPVNPMIQEAAWRTGRTGSPASHEPLEMPVQAWEHAATQLRAAATRLQATPVTDRAAWTGAAREVAGLYSAWSYRVEGDTPGPLRDVARQLGRTAGGRAPSQHVATAKNPRLIAAEAGMLLMIGSGQANQSMAAMMLARQLAELTRSIIEWKRQTGLLEHATRTEKALTTVLASTSTAPGATATAAPPAPLDQDEAMRAQLRARRDAQYRAGRGRPGSTDPGTPPRRDTPPRGPQLGR